MNLICILGGTGFVGHHLVNRLCATGRTVRVLTRNRERHRDLLVLPNAEVVEANIHDYDNLAHHFQDCDAVINLVGILDGGKKGERFRRVHVELPDKVVRACRTTAVKRLLHMSALRASATQGTSAYLRSKGEGEDRVMAAVSGGLQPTVFRPSVIFGPGDAFLNRFGHLLKISPWLMPLPGPEAKFAPVFVADVVNAYTKALEDKAAVGQRYELCGPKVYTLRQLIEYFAHLMGRRRWIIGLNDTLSRVAATAGQTLPGKPFTVDNYLSMQMPNVCGLDGVTDGMAALGITPTALETIAPSILGRRPAHPYQGVHRA